MENDEQVPLTRYSKFVPETDSVEDIRILEKRIRSLLEDTPVSTWENVRGVSESWGFKSGIRFSLREEIFEVLLNEEIDRRKEMGEELPSVVIPDDSEDDEEAITLRDWQDVAKLVFPENKWRINQVLPLSGFTFLAATSGGSKTWVAMEMVNALTTPRAFLHEDFFTTEGCNVLYIDGEMSLSEFQSRGRQLGFSDVRKFSIFILNRNVVDLYNETSDHLDLIEAEIRAKNIGVVIIDTFRATAGGLKEEKAEEVRKFFTRLRRLKSLDVSVMVLDHLRKRLPGEGKTPNKEQLFSSMDKAASADVIEMLKFDSDSGAITMYQVKNRLGRELKAFRMRMTDSDIAGSAKNHIAINFDQWLVEEESQIELAKSIILEVLEDESRTRKELLDITKKHGVPGERTVRRAYKELVDTGQIESVKDGKELRFSLKSPRNGGVEEENDNDGGTLNSHATVPLSELFKPKEP